LLTQPVPVRLETRRELGVRRPRRRGSCIHNDVECWCFTLRISEPLAQQALEPVALHGVAGRAHAHGEAEPRMAEEIFSRDHEEICITRSSAPGVNVVELGLIGEAPAAREATRGR
jgi:hypothetical protein